MRQISFVSVDAARAAQRTALRVRTSCAMWTLIAVAILSYRRESNKQPTQREKKEKV
jgi:hypothetical protein